MNPETSSQAQAQELLSIAAHDLRNPLSCIQGYAEFLMSRDLPQDERAKMLARILSCSRFMEQLIGDVLDAEALERGELPMKASPMTLGDVVSRAVEAMQHSATSRAVSLTVSAASAGGPVLADAARVRQVLVNLVSNAIKHVEPGSGKVEVRLHDLDEEMVLEVADNGSGIAPEHLQRIFEKFYQADEEHSRGSLGLGLFIARRIVEKHGGRLWARSAGPGRGASFYVGFPKHDPEKEFQKFKARRGAATPPPRRLPEEPAAPARPRRDLRLLAPLAFAGILAALSLFARALPTLAPTANAATVGPVR